jgi:hypothetical protein
LPHEQALPWQGRATLPTQQVYSTLTEDSHRHACPTSACVAAQAHVSLCVHAHHMKATKVWQCNTIAAPNSWSEVNTKFCSGTGTAAATTSRMHAPAAAQPGWSAAIVSSPEQALRMRAPQLQRCHSCDPSHAVIACLTQDKKSAGCVHCMCALQQVACLKCRELQAAQQQNSPESSSPVATSVWPSAAHHTLCLVRHTHFARFVKVLRWDTNNMQHTRSGSGE